MCTRSKLPDVREIEILSDQETTISLSAIPDHVIRPAIDTLILNCICLMAESRKNTHQRGG